MLCSWRAVGKGRKAHHRPILANGQTALGLQEHKAAAGAPERADCYGPADLRIGRTVSVYGRGFLITDCDDFTRKWLQARACRSTCIS